MPQMQQTQGGMPQMQPMGQNQVSQGMSQMGQQGQQPMGQGFTNAPQGMPNLGANNGFMNIPDNLPFN